MSEESGRLFNPSLLLPGRRLVTNLFIDDDSSLLIVQ